MIRVSKLSKIRRKHLSLNLEGEKPVKRATAEVGLKMSRAPRAKTDRTIATKAHRMKRVRRARIRARK